MASPKPPPKSGPKGTIPAAPEKPPAQHQPAPEGAATAAQAPDPRPNPLKNPPPPNLPKRRPGRPRKDDPTAPAAIQAASPPPEQRWRELPKDADELAGALASVRSEAVGLLTLVDVVATRLPPGKPLSVEEQAAIQGPLEQVLWKYGANVPPEWQLLAGVGMVVVSRYLEAKASAPRKPARAEPLPGETPMAAANEPAPTAPMAS